MKAIQFDRFGPPEVLEVVDVPMPAVGTGQVLVQVHAAGVNFFEVLMRSDRYAVSPDLPMAPGVEVAGVVAEIGEGVAPSLIGMRVGVPLFALGRSGGYAEFVAVDAASVVPLPDDLSDGDAVALMVQALTALHLVRRSPPRGKAVLVHAAAGGVGSLLVQLAKREGARLVLATAGSEGKRRLALDLGADFAIDYTQPDWPGVARARNSGNGVDLIYDTVGAEVTWSSLDALSPCGELVFAGLGRLSLNAGDLNRLFDRNQSIKGFALLPLLSGDALRRDLLALFDLAASGELRLSPTVPFALQDAASAHRAVESRNISGKVVLCAGPNPKQPGTAQ